MMLTSGASTVFERRFAPRMRSNGLSGANLKISVKRIAEESPLTANRLKLFCGTRPGGHRCRIGEPNGLDPFRHLNSKPSDFSDKPLLPD
jgi:hypothetical protein